MPTQIFDIKQDNEIVTTGGFFCFGCLVGKPTSELSLDPRYCQSCYEFLLKEAELLDQKHRGAWSPKIVAKKTAENPPPIPNHAGGIMATVENKNITVAIIQPTVPEVTSGKRGPKPRALPMDLITQWAGEGMGSKRITTRLNTEYGIKVGFRTIARIIAGQRVLV